jgi:AraC-like DNA-binding protein
VSERALHYAFREVRGLSPMAYFKASRLNAARRELKSARADAATVHEIARRWGFWHSGEFAADYRRLIGELPSQTFNGSPRCRPPATDCADGAARTRATVVSWQAGRPRAQARPARRTGTHVQAVTDRRRRRWVAGNPTITKPF